MPLSYYLITFLFVATTVVWIGLIRRVASQQPLLEWNPEPRSNWRTAQDYTVIYIALMSVVFPLMSAFSEHPPSKTSEFSLKSAAIDGLISLGIVALLPLIVYAGKTSLSSIGMSLRNLPEQLKVGFAGFCATILPMVISMLVTRPIRPLEQEHILLKRIAESPDIATIAVVAGMAAVAAPLKEELVFRVILQGWLTTFLPRFAAIFSVAVLFSLVHGWRNGLALLPLALILGYVFDRRNSYVAVVVIHALFNSSMLLLRLLDLRTK